MDEDYRQGNIGAIVDAQSSLKTLLDRLAPLSNITSRSIFGEHEIYWNGTICGIGFEDRLYLKVDDQNRPDLERCGMGPFLPNERQTLKSYFELPQDVLADPKKLLSWAKQAIRAAQT